MRSRTSSRCSRGRRGLLALTASCGLLALAAAPAVAVDRYVTPGGSGSECTQAKPCALELGINDAAAGDVVHVAGDLGPYLDPKFLSVGNGVTAVGEGAQRPRIVFGASGQSTVFPGARVTRLDLSTGNPGVVVSINEGAIGSQLMVESDFGLPVQVTGILTDSVVRSGKANVPAVQILEQGALTNVTAIATGPGAEAIRVLANFPPCPEPNIGTLRNVIARGNGFDLYAYGSSGCTSTINVGHSNYRAGAVKTDFGTIVDAGGNQTAIEPLLAADGFHQLAGSPTMDAGIGGLGNTLDLDGEPRSMGGAPDIGADEFPSVLDTVAPVGSGLAFKPNRFLPKRGKSANISLAPDKPKRRTPKTSQVSYQLSENASTVFSVERKVRGVRRGKRCLSGRAAKGKRGKRCTRFVAVRKGTLTHAGTAGANGFRFRGVFGGSPLRPGPYRMTGIPTDAAGNAGAPFRASFRIAKR